ncbi:glycosyl hydrolase family 38 [candidate division KSB1 bacterium]|nr:glycosyl hydrolase family 38 [candidate division KSB1 bacterium]
MKNQFVVMCVILFTALAFMISATTQAGTKKRGNWFSGFERIVDGKPFSYHSPQPDVTTSLLIRATKGINTIAWDSETVPADIQADYITLVWMFGIKVSPESYRFELFVNDEPWFTFQNPKTIDRRTWAVSGKDSSLLTFKASMVDKYNDLMGYASLKLPVKLINPGEPVRLKMVAEEANSTVWYMTFIEKVVPDVKILPRNAVLKDEGKLSRPISIGIVHLDEPTEAVIESSHGVMRMRLTYGYNSLLYKIPPEEDKINLKVTVPSMEPVLVQRELEPITEWTVHLVTHSHTDIGYTRPQSEILPEHLRFLDYALDYCDITDSYPEEAQFKWTCEVSWPVSEYLKRRPQSQIDRLLRRIKEGRIEVAGMYLNYSEIVDENMLAAQLKPLFDLKKAGIHVRTAMQNDVNGIGWCLVDYFHDIGIDYVNMGEHGHRALIPFDKPTAFWWVSPSGKRVLAYRAEHYMTGNMWGIHTGTMRVFEDNLFNYFESLTDRKYPFTSIAIQYSGYMTDNSPPSTSECDFIREWNNTYAWPKLRTATVSEFIKHIEDHHGNDIEVIRGAWPDWWTDGVGSAARETGVTRKTQSELIAVEGLLSMARLLGAQIKDETFDEIEEIEDDLLFYGEHTYGAAESVTDPMCENSMVQWGEKSSYAWEAFKNTRLLQEQAMGLIAPYLPKSIHPSIAVFNTLNWKRSGVVTLYIDHQLVPSGVAFDIIDEDGNKIMAQVSHSKSDGTYWNLYATDVPAMGYKYYHILVKDESASDRRRVESATLLENEYYRITIHEETGSISSLYDKVLNREIVDQSSRYKPGQLIYEEIYDRHQLERFTLSQYDRTIVTNVRIEPGIDGPIWKSIMVLADLKSCEKGSARYEIRLYKPEKRVEISYSIRKLPITDPEAIYVAFPFRANEDWKFLFEAQGGLVQSGKDQIEGTSSDWSTVQSFVILRDSESQIVLGSDEIPLMQLGGLNLGQFKYLANPDSSQIYSWILNNYWVTNFRASQEGELTWSYYLTSTEDRSDIQATRFGWSSRIPMPGRVFPPGLKTTKNIAKSLLSIEAENLLLVNCIPCKDRRGLILHFREIAGKTTVFMLPGFRIARVNVFGEELEKVSAISLKPHETAFFRVEAS